MTIQFENSVDTEIMKVEASTERNYSMKFIHRKLTKKNGRQSNLNNCYFMSLNVAILNPNEILFLNYF